MNEEVGAGGRHPEKVSLRENSANRQAVGLLPAGDSDPALTWEFTMLLRGPAEVTSCEHSALLKRRRGKDHMG